MNAGSDSAVELKQRGFLSRCCSTDRGRIITAVVTSLLTGFGLTFVAQLIAKQVITLALQWITVHPFAALANTVLIALIVLVLGWLVRSIFASTLIASIAVMAAATVNYFKILITSTPFFLSDIGLIGKATDIAKLNSSSLSVTPAIAKAIAGVVIWLVIVFIVSRKTRLKHKKSLVSALAALVVLAVIFGIKPVTNTLIFKPIGMTLDYGLSQMRVYENAAVPLGLWREAERIVYAGPQAEEGITDEMLAKGQALIDGVEPGGSDVKPNIIFVVSESFSDVTKLPGVEYAEDPLADFHSAQEQGVSGAFYTRSLGYGTCNIELEMLTGINTRFLSYDEQLCYQSYDLFSPFKALPRTFAENGYYTAFMHTFNDSIYNRELTFTQLGFEDIFFSSDFAKIDDDAASAHNYWEYMNERISGDFYSDDYMAELFIKLFEKKSPESPVFLYGLTMENHTPYPADKYDSYEYPFSSALPEDAVGCLNAYTQGCANASKSLGKLIDYFSGVDEPTIIIFLGDHRAGLSLGSSRSLYTELGMCSSTSSLNWTPEETALLYSTDYVIWANVESLLPGEPGSTRDTSAAFMGADTLRLAGIELDPLWRMVAAIGESCIAYEWEYAVDLDGNAYSTLPSSIDPDKFSTMSWFTRQAIYGKDDVAFYRLRN